MRAFNNSRSVERIIYGLIAYVLNQKQDMPENEFTQRALKKYDFCCLSVEGNLI
jgi:hypothetical protein